MRKIQMLFLAVAICTSCDKIVGENYVNVKVPVLEGMSEIRKLGITVENDTEIMTYGKIYLYKNLLLINEPDKGIHIYDNSNPASPDQLAFISIPGNVDLVVKDDILYADSYIDLLSFDLSNPLRPVLVDRREEVFMSVYNFNDRTDMLTIGYKDTIMHYEDVNVNNPSVKENLVYNNYTGGGAVGQGGSMARFTLSQNHLYTVDNSSLRLFDLVNKSKPSFVKNIALGWGIETVFPYKDNLFIGSNSGMYIYDVSKPSDPKQLSWYSHMRACDPVVVNEDYAFVTLRTGAACAGTQNVLEVIDIKDLKNPKLVKSYQMENPHGLGLSGDYLYLCEGKFGFKSFNVADVLNVDKHQLEHLKNLESTDVIPGPKSLIVVGANGVCQYDYSDKERLKLLSCIEAVKYN